MIYKKIEIAVDGYKETADLYTYFLDNSIEMHINRKRPVVVICPGGGYAMTSDREAEPIAMQYLVRGYHAVILRYSVEPASSKNFFSGDFGMLFCEVCCFFKKKCCRVSY